MLRPEQIVLRAARESSTTGEALGEILHIDFAGAVSTLAIRLVAENRTISLRQSLADLPSVGSTVRLAIESEAHVFSVTP